MSTRRMELRRESDDPVERAAALGFHPDESGDLMVVLQPNWVFSTPSANHGTGHAYDRHVPLIFFGPMFTPGRYDTPATPADLAPTLASTAGISLGEVDGRPRMDALRK